MATHNKASFEKQWKQIEKHFEWKVVQRVMQSLGWKWIIKGFTVTPDITDLKQESQRLLTLAFTDGRSVSCGGLSAGNNDGLLWLKFVVTDWHFELPTKRKERIVI